MDGTFDVQRDLRPQFRTGSCAIQEDFTSNEEKVVKVSGWKAWLHKFVNFGGSAVLNFEVANFVNTRAHLVVQIDWLQAS